MVRRRRRFTLAAAGILAAASLTVLGATAASAAPAAHAAKAVRTVDIGGAVLTAGTAKAGPLACQSGYSRLYLDESGSDYGLTAEGVGNAVEVLPGTGDCWQFPAGNGSYARIYDGSNCLEVFISLGENAMEPCDGAESQTWQGAEISPYYYFANEEVQNSGGSDPQATLCADNSGVADTYVCSGTGDLESWTP
jgi:hypothetical protein